MSQPPIISYISNESTPRHNEILRGSSVYDGVEIEHYQSIIKNENNTQGIVTVRSSNELMKRYHWAPATLEYFSVKFSRGVLNWSDVQIFIKDQLTIARHFNALTFKSGTADVYRSSDVMRTVMFVTKRPEIETPRMPVGIYGSVHEFVDNVIKRSQVFAQRSASIWAQSAFSSCAFSFDATKGDARTSRCFRTITAPTKVLTDTEINWIKSQTQDWYDITVLPHDRCFSVAGTGLSDDPRNATVVWHGLAHLRAPRLHSEIVDMVTIWPDLPPYVILEVIDWLPQASVMTHRKKIDLIYAVKASIRKLIEKDE